jgi:hypothetical protein
MSDLARRRTRLGTQRSAALPLIWDALERQGWSDARLSAEMGEDTAAVSRLLYGDRKANRKQSVKLHELLGIPFSAWDEPTALKRRRHQSPRPAKSSSDVSASAAADTRKAG